ncbi:hypothetical protein K7X08_024622 [Anisodus acutangulus]|uniref:Uncharacterized protein n=1 Tax=Anisodus acutangulus TaxID=402998 RepID=A0A9Q1RFV7_9SOLA|nr:hypothetical protein K7X08_024622 [Anisodus acutangulus]
MELRGARQKKSRLPKAFGSNRGVGTSEGAGTVAAFAEYLSFVEAISDEFDAKLLRMRYGALLWDYAARKIDVNAMSDSEVPQKPVRPVIDFDKVETINV